MGDFSSAVSNVTIALSYSPRPAWLLATPTNIADGDSRQKPPKRNSADTIMIPDMPADLFLSIGAYLLNGIARM